MIVPDGRTGIEKLRELLTETEQTHLDFKERVDLRNKRDELNLIKDVVAMSNRPSGGYLLIGVRDNGELCCPTGTIQRRDFDGANIGQKVRAVVESEVHVITAIHEIDGNEIVVIYSQPHSDGLPVPMAKLGQYPDGGKPIVVFRPGDIFVREGPSNVQIRHCHWKDILSHRDRLTREQAMTDAQSLIGEFVKHLQPGEGPNNAGAAAAPLLLDMHEEAFANAVVTNFEAGNDTRIQTFLVQSRNSFAQTATSGGDTAPTLDRIATVAAQGVMYGRHLPTVGILLCAGRNDNVVRYSLAGTQQPIAVADYTYDALPATLRELLPTEAELSAATDTTLNTFADPPPPHLP